MVCQHHWLIESPEGPTSMGTCKRCGAVKEFSNVCPIDDNALAIAIRLRFGNNIKPETYRERGLVAARASRE